MVFTRTTPPITRTNPPLFLFFGVVFGGQFSGVLLSG